MNCIFPVPLGLRALLAGLLRGDIGTKACTIPAGEWALGAGASSADLRQTATLKL